MPKIGDIVKIIEDFAPLSFQADYDNSGLICGDPKKAAKGVLVTLDLTPEVAEEAREKGCNLIIEHHPSIFHPLRTLDENYPAVKALLAAVKNGAAVYAAHTNVDFADGGLNDNFIMSLGVEKWGFLGCDRQTGRIGKLKAPLTLKDFVSRVKEISGKTSQYVGNPGSVIRTVAAVNGGGASEEAVLAAKEAGADIFVSADFKYNVIRLAKDLDYAIIDFGHYESEIGFIKLIAGLLREKCKIPVFEAEKCKNPYTIQE